MEKWEGPTKNNKRRNAVLGVSALAALFGMNEMYGKIDESRATTILERCAEGADKSHERILKDFPEADPNLYILRPAYDCPDGRAGKTTVDEQVQAFLERHSDDSFEIRYRNYLEAWLVKQPGNSVAQQ
ncbi:MAG TPA: hypothetical protein VI957_02405 [Candidatus Paceibacterota bacterium]